MVARNKPFEFQLTGSHGYITFIRTDDTGLVVCLNSTATKELSVVRVSSKIESQLRRWLEGGSNREEVIDMKAKKPKGTKKGK